jgi:hypothetical protein
MAAKKTILFELVLNRIDNKSKEGTKIIKKDITFALSRLLDGNAKFLDIREYSVCFVVKVSVYHLV